MPGQQGPKHIGLSKHEAFILWVYWEKIGLNKRRKSALFNIFGKNYQLYIKYLEKLSHPTK